MAAAKKPTIKGSDKDVFGGQKVTDTSWPQKIAAPWRIACALLAFATTITVLYRLSDTGAPRTSPTTEIAKPDTELSTRTALTAPKRSPEQLADEFESITRGFGTGDKTRGAITVSTEPEGARIFVDDAFVGEASGVRVPKVLEAGIHEVTAVLAGHSTAKALVPIEAGQNESIHLRLDLELTVPWKATLSGISPAAIYANQNVIVGTGVGGSVAFDSESGRRLWFHPVKPDSHIVMSQGFYIWSTGREFGVMDLRTGTTSWNYQFQDTIIRIAVGSSVIFAVETTGTLHAIGLRTGEPLWRKSTRSEFSAVLAQGDMLYVWETDAGCQAIEALTGKTIWRRRGEGNQTLFGATRSDGDTNVFSSEYPEGRLLTLDATTGEIENIDDAVSDVHVLHNEYLMFIKQWYVREKPLNLLRWRPLSASVGRGGAIEVDGMQERRPLICLDGRTAFFADKDLLSAVAMGQQTVRWSKTISGISNLCRLDDDLLLVATGSILLALDENTGTKVWEIDVDEPIQTMIMHEYGAYILSGDTVYKVAIEA